MERRTFFVDGPGGWQLCLKRSCRAEGPEPRLRPVLVLPGYGMNSFIFGYHPAGTSLVDGLVERGHEVWTADLRAQGATRPPRRRRRSFGLEHLALDDLPVVIDFVLERTRTRAERVVGVGCSLGGSLLYAHVGLHAGHRVGALVAMGAPLRWEDMHPVCAALRHAPRLARLGALPGGGVVAPLALPILLKVPRLLSVYLHPEIVDLPAPYLLGQAVSDLLPRLNEEIARWMRHRDLVLRGRNVTDAFLATRLPLLCVLGVGDGIVPEATGLSACRRPEPAVSEVLRVGDEEQHFGHADLFLSAPAPERVFTPMARWIEGPGQS